tara:strand:+ start:629 stop:919 length:291 start_codon:yes stop_codon:yes gene_type:complete
MITSTKQSQEKQKEAQRLFNQGLNNKEIASKLEVQEKTVGVWLKHLKERFIKMQKIEKQLLQKIEDYLSNKETTPKDLRDLFASLHILKAHQLKKV